MISNSEASRLVATKESIAEKLNLLDPFGIASYYAFSTTFTQNLENLSTDDLAYLSKVIADKLEEKLRR